VSDRLGTTDAPRALTPPGWPRPSGYADGMTATGRIIVTAGQIGWDPVTQQILSDDMAAQVRQALQNIVQVLRAGGASPEHLVRLTWYVTDRDGFLDAHVPVGDAYREVIGRHFPAMAVVVVSGLLEARAKVEIEATAVIPE
jgi:enamine deaminase RidA (YjgF/YER057c/UK114 family)